MTLKKLPGNGTKLDYWVQRVLPQVYDDSMSYYELLNKVVHYLNENTDLGNKTKDLANEIVDHIQSNKWIVEKYLGDKQVSRRNIKDGAIGVGQIDPEIMKQPTSELGVQAKFQLVDEQLAQTGIQVNKFGYEDSAFQQAINQALSTGIKKITVPKGNYKLENLIVLDGLNGFEIEILKGAKVHTEKHGWGIFEVVRSKNVHIHGNGVIGGSHTFVDKNFNNTNGGGEKHAVLNSGLQWGAYRNDQLKTLGVFEGGYVGNCGFGVLIHDGCENIKVDVEIQGFTTGVQVGFRGDTTTQDQNISKNIVIRGFIHHCYSGAIEYYAVDGIDTRGCIIEDIGHPHAVGTDQVIDPGYGVSATAVSDITTQAKNIKNNFMTIRRTKRRGVDTHVSENLQILGNYIEECLVNGIGLTGSIATRKQVDVMFNTMKRCGVATTGAIADLKSGVTNTYDFANITKNRFVDCGSNTVIYSSANHSKVDDNILESTTEIGKSDFHTGIDIASGVGGSVKGNIIKGKFKRGVRFRTNVKGIFDHNEIDISWPSEVQRTLFENSDVKIGVNNVGGVASSLGNKVSTPKKYVFLLEYSTVNAIPVVTPLNGDDLLPYQISSGGSGAFIRFDVPVDVSTKSYSILSQLSDRNTNLAYIRTFTTFSGGRNLDFYVSPRRADKSVITANHSDIDGLRIILEVNIVGIV